MFAPTVAICPNVPLTPSSARSAFPSRCRFGSCQARLIWVVEAAVADRPVGASGEAPVPVPGHRSGRSPGSAEGHITGEGSGRTWTEAHGHPLALASGKGVGPPETTRNGPPTVAPR